MLNKKKNAYQNQSYRIPLEGDGISIHMLQQKYRRKKRQQKRSHTLSFLFYVENKRFSELLKVINVVQNIFKIYVKMKSASCSDDKQHIDIFDKS